MPDSSTAPPTVSSAAAAPAVSELLVACLCADWCRTCGSYREVLLTVRDDLRAAHPAWRTRFVWIDIEDEAELIGDLDIENFPTIVLARGAAVLFAGPVMPHAGTIERLVQGAIDGSLGPPLQVFEPDDLALPGRLAGHGAL
jgi:hypothetical protein